MEIFINDDYLSGLPDNYKNTAPNQIVSIYNYKYPMLTRIMAEIYTLDMHTHLLEKNTDVEDFWKRTLEMKLDAVAITEHADCSPKEAYNALLEKKPDNVLLIPGVEVNSELGHVIAFYPNEEIYEIQELFEKKVTIKKLLEINKEKNVMLSIAHPWGLSHDSFAYKYGSDKLEDLVIEENIGVEVYNGIMGYLADFIYDSGWVRRPTNFFDFLAKNRVARKTGLGRVGAKVKSKIDKKTLEIVQRCENALELGEKAKFITAGSDAHSSMRVGSGIIKIRSENKINSNKEMLEHIRNNKENVIWSGPYVKEVSPGMYEHVEDPLRRKEIIQGLKYATGKAIKKAGKKFGKKEANHTSD